MSNLLRSAIYYFWGGIVLAHGLWACAQVPVIPPAPFEQAQALAAWRSETEGNVKRIKTKYPVESAQYREAERRYIGLESKANAWIHRLRTDLANGVDLWRSEDFEDALEAVFQKYEAFMSYCDSIASDIYAPRPTRESRIDPVVVKETSRRIWQEYVRSDRQRKDAIQAELRKLKWKDFDDV